MLCQFPVGLKRVKRSLQLSHTMVFLNLSKSIINEKATILFQVFKWSTKDFLGNY